MTQFFSSKQASKYLLSGLLLTTPIAHALPNYTLTQLNALETGLNGLSQSYAAGINASGQVVGYAFSPSSTSRAVLWDAGSSTAINLGTLGGNYSHATAINDDGVIVGDSHIAGNTRARATIWQAGATTPTALSDFGSHAYAKDINNAGQIVGAGYLNGNYDAIFWETASSTANNIGGLSALGVNAIGQVVGYLSTGGGAAFWVTGSNTPTALGGLGGDGVGKAEDINDSGKVVGWAREPSGGNFHAFSWQVGDNSLTDLGTLFGAGSSYAHGINASGQIVGSSADYNSGPQRATLWQTDSLSPIDLNSLVALPFGYLYEAVGINDAGQIIANATNGRAFLLTPNVAAVPLPGAAWLFGSALLGIIGMRRDHGPKATR